jgi:hypothetical protein
MLLRSGLHDVSVDMNKPTRATSMLTGIHENPRYWCSESSVQQPHRPVYRNSLHL